MTKGEGGQKSQKIDDVFYERPHTLNSSYDKNNICTIKIVVYTFSVYPDISFGNKKSEKITDISFHNRNNRNNKNNRNELQKMLKMVSVLLSTKLGSLSVILKTIFITKLVSNIKQKSQTKFFREIPATEVKPSSWCHG